MDNGNSASYESMPTPTTTRPAPTIPQNSPEEQRRQRMTIIGIVIGGLVVLVGLIAGVIYLAQPGPHTEKIRDIFIIFMALEFMVLGLAMVILIIQLATLINLLQNEVKPILESTNETANTLRGTAVFLSENLSDPVIKMGGYLAAFRRLAELMKIATKD